jgi:hypothetical protein
MAEFIGALFTAIFMTVGLVLSLGVIGAVCYAIGERENKR